MTDITEAETKRVVYALYACPDAEAVKQWIADYRAAGQQRRRARTRRVRDQFEAGEGRAPRQT